MNNELRKKYKIPETKILPDLLAEQNPEWSKNLKCRWWQKDNLRKIDVSQMSEESASVYSVFKRLNEIMLEIGGSETCFTCLDDDYVKLLERGYYRDGKSRMAKGEPCRCHSNAARIYDERAEEDDVIICTGFALSKDGMWRPHSWLIQEYMSKKGQKTRILETTAKRIAYFGFELTHEEAEEFAELNHF